jgi:hypothetical protein
MEHRALNSFLTTTISSPASTIIMKSLIVLVATVTALAAGAPLLIPYSPDAPDFNTLHPHGPPPYINPVKWFSRVTDGPVVKPGDLTAYAEAVKTKVDDPAYGPGPHRHHEVE